MPKIALKSYNENKLHFFVREWCVREWAGMPRIVFTFCPLRDSSIKDDDSPGSDRLGVGGGGG
jgi:hypothetical protein